ncbi:DUF4166 domain-containing protein [Brevibacillus humidisoli]|uniref:DUF4166 domain-containing protein n=1 Tax=Brevibacillus humidisoli TaxID=2895522 RepID=UPI001E30241E|nr:DUF4166 domain-containing protein [Brevibacillus humidisoli]UFJ41866.1 DUF4166 domain-containing protein [Brevibacillus humidisoli]
MKPSLFELALQHQTEHLPEGVKLHVLLPPDAPYQIVMDGNMEQIWHRPRWIKPLLWLLSKMDTFFPETGKEVPLLLENSSYCDREGVICMEWRRTFTFPGKIRRFNALMRYNPDRQIIVDYFGKGGWLEADLLVKSFGGRDAGGLEISSSGYRLRLGRFLMRVPGLLSPRALIREWTEDGMQPDEIKVDVRLHHPWIGDFFGYSGRFTVRRRVK